MNLKEATAKSASVVSELAGVLHKQPEESCVAASTFTCAATLLAHHGIDWQGIGDGGVAELMSDIYDVVARFATKCKAEHN